MTLPAGKKLFNKSVIMSIIVIQVLNVIWKLAEANTLAPWGLQTTRLRQHGTQDNIGHILCTFTHILINSQRKNIEKSKEWEKILCITQAHQTTGPWELNKEKPYHNAGLEVLKKGGMKGNNTEKFWLLFEISKSLTSVFGTY